LSPRNSHLFFLLACAPRLRGVDGRVVPSAHVRDMHPVFRRRNQKTRK
jgi:hypothetical protein